LQGHERTIIGREAEINAARVEIGNARIEINNARTEIRLLQENKTSLEKEKDRLVREEAYRLEQHFQALASLQEIKTNCQRERDNEKTEAHEKELARLREMKQTWGRHEEQVRQILKAICQQHTIGYVEKPPFSGKPDNTLNICDELVVFDAKSPAGEDLTNFPGYLRDQAEKAVKYASQENVRSDIFFVVPTNTLEALQVFVYRHGGHDVYILSLDALEPVILSLKKIEEYEFAEQLRPEDRENICRVLGRFAHLSKRRIQIDSFFARQFIALAYKCETDLPEDFLKSVLEFERSEKLNPPMEKRQKAIPTRELEKEYEQIRREADGKGINLDEGGVSDGLDGVPLYK
jgi:hypothetical protein